MKEEIKNTLESGVEFGRYTFMSLSNNELSYIVQYIIEHNKDVYIEMNLWDCSSLIHLRELSKLNNLKFLYMSGYQGKSYAFLKGYKHLRTLQVTRCFSFDFKALAKIPTLNSLSVNLWERVKLDISHLRNVVNLTELKLFNINIENCDFLSPLVHLKKLTINMCNIIDINGLRNLQQLEELTLHDNQISDISALKSLHNLSSLDLSYNQISDVSALKSLHNLSSLNLSHNQISDVSALKSLHNLSNLYLSYNQISDASGLKTLGNLQKLDLSNNVISNLIFLEYLNNITSLDLNNNLIVDITPIKKLIKLEILTIQNNKIQNIQALQYLTKLKECSLFNNQIKDITPLIKFIEYLKNDRYNSNELFLDSNPLKPYILRMVEEKDFSLLLECLKDNLIISIHESIFEFIDKSKNLFCTLNTNIQGIKKGFWFLGDEHELFFSFWQGYEWRNKTPNIFFSVTKDGNSSLAFVCAEDEKKLEFFKEVAETLNITKKEDTTIHHWVKNYKGTDYIKSLEEFLKRDKKIIDAFIKSYDMQTVFPPIDEQEFLIAKQRIEKEREQLKIQTYVQNDNTKKYIILKSLTFKNISLFDEEYTIQFHRNLTCFIGLNGTGKTSILRGIALAFTGFEQNDLNTTEEKISLARNLQHLLHIKGIKKEAKDYPSEGGYIELNYQVGEDETTYQNRVLLTLENEEPKISDDSNSEFRNFNDKFFRSLFLAFPQLHGSSKPRNIPKKPNIYDVLPLLNNEPDNRFEAFGKWLRGLNAKANEKKAQGQPNPPESKLLDTVFKIVSDVVGESIKVHKIVVINKTDDIIWVQLGENSKPIVLELISQGYNNVFGWIGYFMMRLVEATVEDPDDIAKEIDFSQLPAIVLIDEIDTYLHPDWQYTILRTLMKYFPKVQFIVTTHSPFALTSVHHDQMYIYNLEKEQGTATIKEVQENLYGADANRVTDVMSEERLPEIKQKFVELKKLINGNQLDAAEAMLANDFVGIKDADPDIVAANSRIRTKRLFQKK